MGGGAAYYKKNPDALWDFWLDGPGRPSGRIWGRTVTATTMEIKRLFGKAPTALFPVEGYGGKQAELDADHYNKRMRGEKVPCRRKRSKPGRAA